MKVPFRQQVSDYDCVPTSVINALIYLFSRNEIPPSVVQQVYKHCLDVESSRGTSTEAMEKLSCWLNSFKDTRFKKFALKATFIRGEQVHLRQRSKILRCINAQGAALICVHSSRNYRHGILGYRTEGRWLNCYDPVRLSKRFINQDAVEFLPTIGVQEPNMRIHFDWLEKDFEATKNPIERKYVLGSICDRECLLLNRLRE